MRAKLTLVYEKEVPKAAVPGLKQAVEDGADEILIRFFGIGQNVPKERRIIVLEN